MGKIDLLINNTGTNIRKPALAILLFASDDFNFITGQTLFVDGGSGDGWVVQWEEVES
jgi:hypothetical protein